MHRNFGVRERARDYWDEHSDESESKWPIVVLVVAVVILVGFGIFVA